MPSCQEFTSASIYHASEFTQWRRVIVLLPQKTWWEMTSSDMTVTLTFTSLLAWWIWRKVKHKMAVCIPFFFILESKYLSFCTGDIWKIELMKIWFPKCPSFSSSLFLPQLSILWENSLSQFLWVWHIKENDTEI